MLAVAFKEWAAVCRALAAGRQSLILRKGGIAEAGGRFRPEHDRFWLFPTHFHADPAMLKPDAAGLLESAAADRPSEGVLRLAAVAAVARVWRADRLDAVLALDDLHVWAADVVRQRFAYRSPGLYVLAVRVAVVDPPAAVPDRPEYAGCKTWVPLDPGADAAPAVPAVGDARFAVLVDEIGRRLSG